MKQIFLNLPVEDLERSVNFYTQLGFTVNPLFTDDDQKCMVWSESIYLMLKPPEVFKKHSGENIPDTKNFEATIFTLPVESPEKVNEIIESGLKTGGTEPVPMKDHGFMQLRKLADPDGHTWDIIYLDMDKFREVKEKS
ncbi:MAG: glyoxalase/bleomycin resistance/extradiol dioxygenase family protein [Ignavibacteria bacterium]|nr:glyoxalase/bleomycin resistance/extradiol dioxygenase family protein [Ignavibacteria bacterium]